MSIENTPPEADTPLTAAQAAEALSVATKSLVDALHDQDLWRRDLNLDPKHRTEVLGHAAAVVDAAVMDVANAQRTAGQFEEYYRCIGSLPLHSAGVEIAE